MASRESPPWGESRDRLPVPGHRTGRGGVARHSVASSHGALTAGSHASPTYSVHVTFPSGAAFPALSRCLMVSSVPPSPAPRAVGTMKQRNDETVRQFTPRCQGPRILGRCSEERGGPAESTALLCGILGHSITSWCDWERVCGRRKRWESRACRQSHDCTPGSHRARSGWSAIVGSRRTRSVAHMF
jgi:hypothetical protein